MGFRESGDRAVRNQEMGSRLVGMRFVWIAAAGALCVLFAGRAYVNVLVRDLSRTSTTATLEIVAQQANSLLGAWSRDQARLAEWWGRDERVVALTEELLAEPRTPQALREAPAQTELRKLLSRHLETMGYRGFFVIEPKGISLASTRDANTGTPNLVAEAQPEDFALALECKPTVSASQVSDVPLEDASGSELIEMPATMFALAPVLNQEGACIAVFALRLDVFRSIGERFGNTRWGDTGELLALDARGRVLAGSRTEGFLAQAEESSSGSVRMLNEAMTIGPQCDAEGYRSLSGQKVVGAWVWNEALGIGVGAEMSKAEAYAVRNMTERAINGFTAGIALMVCLCALLSSFSHRRSNAQLRMERELADARDLALKEAEEAILETRESGARFRGTFEQAAVGIAHVSLDGRWLRLNDKLCEITGYSREELEAKTVLSITHPDDRDADIALVHQVLAGEREHYSAEKRYLTKEGGEVWVNLTVSLIREEDAKPQYFMKVVEDITVRKSLEEGLIHASENLEQQVEERTADLARSNRDLEQFAYVASHDLQEPLRMVTSYLQLLERRYGAQLDGDALEFMNYAVDGSIRMKMLIEDLLAYARLGATLETSTEAEMNEVVAEALGNLTGIVEESGAAIHTGNLPTVTGKSTLLVQVVQNIVENAIKYRGSEPPKLEITAEKRAEEWVFCIEDNGIGMEAAHTDRVFIIFQRLHRDAAIPGTGIGLASCKKIIEGHGGRIWVESIPGQGSRFYFTLPLERNHVEELVSR